VALDYSPSKLASKTFTLVFDKNSDRFPIKKRPSKIFQNARDALMLGCFHVWKLACDQDTRLRDFKQKYNGSGNKLQLYFLIK
jgi:hypothetical protein